MNDATSGPTGAAGRRIAVVGGGIAGLAAAVEIVGNPGWTVTVFEAGERLGGKIATSPFGGVPAVDEGPDAFLARMPAAVRLAEQVGLGADALTSPERVSAAVWYDGLHRLPDGLLLGVPAAVAPFARTRLLSWRGKARAALEPLLPRTDPDDSLGRLVRARFGSEVHDRLVDALVGSIYATDTDRASLGAVPQLAALARSHRSLLIGGRAQRRAHPPSDAPIFATPIAGLGALVTGCVDHVRAHGGEVLVGRPVESIEPAGDGWIVDGERFDGVVLASPAPATARLLEPVAPPAAAGLAGVDYADVIMVRLTVDTPATGAPFAGRSGYLVPKSRQGVVTAVSFGSRKWAHWQRPDQELLRVSLGRDGLPVAHLDDDAVTAAVVGEVSRHLDLDLAPRDVAITRWTGAFPQYRPHHADRMAAVTAALPDGLAIAGASVAGIGIPACVASGRAAVRRLMPAEASP